MTAWNQFDHDKYQTLLRFLKQHAKQRSELGYTFFLYEGTHKALAAELGWNEQQLGATHSYMAKAKNAQGEWVCELIQAPTKPGNGIYYCSPYEAEWAVEVLELARYVAEGFLVQSNQLTSWIDGLARRAEAVAQSAFNNGNYDAWHELKKAAEGLVLDAENVKKNVRYIASYVGK